MPQAEVQFDVTVQLETSHTPPSSDMSTRMVAPTVIIDTSPSTSTETTRISPYPLRIRVPKRKWQSMQSITESQDLYDSTSYYEAMSSPNAPISQKTAMRTTADRTF
jgi:hypothetical protein